MFFKRGLIALVIGGFFLAVLMGGATRAAYFAGMQRGYATAVSQIPAPAAPAAEAGPQAAVPPAAPYTAYGHPMMMGRGYDGGYGMSHGHSFIGGFFRVLFFFLLFGWLFRLLRWRRGHWGGWGGHHGRHHWHGHHGSPDGRSAKEQDYDAHGPIMHA